MDTFSTHFFRTGVVEFLPPEYSANMSLTEEVLVTNKGNFIFTLFYLFTSSYSPEVICYKYAVLNVWYPHLYRWLCQLAYNTCKRVVDAAKVIETRVRRTGDRRYVRAKACNIHFLSLIRTQAIPFRKYYIPSIYCAECTGVLLAYGTFTVLGLPSKIVVGDGSPDLN